MLGGFRRGQRGAERAEQLGLLLLRLLEVAALDVAEAADALRNGRDLHGERVVVARETSEQLVDRSLVLADEAPLGPALPGHAERVERRGAQATELREHPERAHHPAAELRF